MGLRLTLRQLLASAWAGESGQVMGMNDVNWSIHEVTKLAGVTARTLRHYRRMQGMTREDVTRMQAQYGDALNGLVELVEAGVPADDPRTLDAMDRHHTWLRNFWTPNKESYAGLGELYYDHPDFRAQFDTLHPGLAAFVRDAMAAYANARLS